MSVVEENIKSLFQYRFGSAEFNEARFELRVAGLTVELQRKPLEILALLLAHAGEVITKEELLEVVWQGRPTVENVIANAVTKLRNALGDDNAVQIVTLRGVGFRLAGSVKRVAVGRTMVSRIELHKGNLVPLHPDFQFESLLNTSRNSEVWLARHVKTKERRVYKFATDNERLSTLKREVTLFRLLHDTLGPREDLVRILDWNFETSPYFIECEYGGESLAEWANCHPALQSFMLQQRIDLFLQIAEVVAAAHDVGVLHKDIKPANVLITPKNDTEWQIRLTDFGSGRVMDPQRIADLGITQLGLTMTVAVDGSDTTGTLLYLAPELMAHQAPTIKSDIYASGLLLYQLIIGDLRKPMVAGWERDIEDELLRDDIRASTDGDPAHRLSSVHELIDRLRTLDARRLSLQRERGLQASALQAHETLRRAQARRPWMIAAVTLLVVGLSISTLLYVRALRVQQQLLHSQSQTRLQASRANAVTEFLYNDVFNAADPFFGEAGQHRTIKEALENAAINMDTKFAQEPMTEASVRMTLGRIFDHMMDNAASEPQWRRAITLLTQAGEPARLQLLQSHYALAQILSRQSRFDLAATELADADRLRSQYAMDDPQTTLIAHESWGLYFYLRQQVVQAIPHITQTLQLLLKQPTPNLTAIDIARIMLGECYIAMNRLQEAEQLSQGLLDELKQRHIPSDLTIATAKSLYAESLLYQRRYEEAEPVINQIYQTVITTLGTQSRFALSILNLRCELYARTDRREHALQCTQQAYDLTRTIEGNHHYVTLVALLNVGVNQYALRRYVAAAHSLETVRAELAQTLGADNPLTQSASYYLARCLLQLHSADQTQSLIQPLDAKVLEGTEPGAPWKLRIQLLHGLVLLAQGQRAEAQALLLPAAQLHDDADPNDTILLEARHALRAMDKGNSDQHLAVAHQSEPHREIE